jgi:hypothetical protein
MSENKLRVCAYTATDLFSTYIWPQWKYEVGWINEKSQKSKYEVATILATEF